LKLSEYVEKSAASAERRRWRTGAADAGGCGVADAFVLAALGDFWGLGVAEQDADADVGVRSGGEELEHAGVFEEE